jgi:hypothetical protein
MMTMRRTLKTEYPLGFKKASAQSAASNDFEILTRLDELSAWSGLQRDDDAVLGALSKKGQPIPQSRRTRPTTFNIILLRSNSQRRHARQLRIIHSPLPKVSVADVLKHGTDSLLRSLLAKQ